MAERGGRQTAARVQAALRHVPTYFARRPLSLLAGAATMGVAVLLLLSLAGGRFSSLRLGGIASADDASGQQQRTAQQVASGTNFTAIAMIAPNDGWAAAWNDNPSNGASPAAFVHYDGHHWTRVPSPVTEPVAAISMLSSQEGWAVAANTFLHYTGGRWAVDSSYIPEGQSSGVSVSIPVNIFHLQMVTPTDGWAIGSEPSATGDSLPLLLRYSDGHWTKQQIPATSQFQALRAISMISADEGWIVGSNYSDDYRQETPLALHYSDGQWTKLEMGFTGALTGVSALPGGDVWAVGEVSPGAGPGMILHYSDGVWRQEPSPTPNMLHDIKMLSATDGWISGDGAATLHWDGRRWTKVGLVIHGVALWQLAMASPSEGWAIGNGVLLHDTHGTWSIYDLHGI